MREWGAGSKSGEWGARVGSGERGARVGSGKHERRVGREGARVGSMLSEAREVSASSRAAAKKSTVFGKFDVLGLHDGMRHLVAPSFTSSLSHVFHVLACACACITMRSHVAATVCLLVKER